MKTEEIESRVEAHYESFTAPFVAGDKDPQQFIEHLLGLMAMAALLPMVEADRIAFLLALSSASGDYVRNQHGIILAQPQLA